MKHDFTKINCCENPLIVDNDENVKATEIIDNEIVTYIRGTSICANCQSIWHWKKIENSEDMEYERSGTILFS